MYPGRVSAGLEQLCFGSPVVPICPFCDLGFLLKTSQEGKGYMASIGLLDHLIVINMSEFGWTCIYIYIYIYLGYPELHLISFGSCMFQPAYLFLGSQYSWMYHA